MSNETTINADGTPKKRIGRPPKGEHLTSFALRLPAKTVERLRWKADAEQREVQDVIREILRDATADIKPPLALISREIRGSEAQWAKWYELLNALGAEDVSELVAPMLDRVYQRKFG